MFAATCEAHVRLLHKPEFTLPIRNAASVSADGTLSTAGPCGGVYNWGNKTFSTVTVGQNLTLVFGYNGGHQSPTLNMLRVAMVCGRINKDDQLKNNSANLATNACPKVNASASLTSGYYLWVVIPALQTGMNGEFCTISVLDERNWGGCVDVQVLPRPGSPTMAPVEQNALIGKNVAGDYTFGSAQCEVDSPACCCVSGNMTVVHVTGATLASAIIRLSTCVYTNGTSRAVDTVVTAQLNQQAITLASLKATVTVGANTLTFTISAATSNTLLMTDDSAAPGYCGVNSPLFRAPGGLTPTSAPTAGGDTNTGAHVVSGGIAGVILASLLAY